MMPHPARVTRCEDNKMISHLIEFLNRFFEKLPLAVLKFRWLIIAIFLATTAFMLHGLVTKFNMDMSLENFFSEKDPVRVTLNRYRQEFGSEDGLYIVYEAKDGDVFSEKSIKVHFNPYLLEIYWDEKPDPAPTSKYFLLFVILFFFKIRSNLSIKILFSSN